MNIYIRRNYNMKLTLNDINYLVTECVRKIVKESNGDITPAVYVGTYGKYNNGSLQGKWINLTDFDSKEEFLQYCRQLHSDEPDAELMFQDYEYIPKIFIGESYIDERFWDFLNDDSYDYDIKYAVANEVSDADEYFDVIDDIQVFPGCNNMSDVAYAYIDDGIYPQHPEYYFDFERFGRDCSFDGPSDEQSESIYQEYGVEEDNDTELGEAIIEQTYGDIANAPKETLIRYLDLDKLGNALSYDGRWVDYDGGMIEIN